MLFLSNFFLSTEISKIQFGQLHAYSKSRGYNTPVLHNAWWCTGWQGCLGRENWALWSTCLCLQSVEESHWMRSCHCLRFSDLCGSIVLYSSLSNYLLLPFDRLLGVPHLYFTEWNHHVIYIIWCSSNFIHLDTAYFLLLSDHLYHYWYLYLC